LNTVWQQVRELLKSINIGDIFKAVMTE